MLCDNENQDFHLPGGVTPVNGVLTLPPGLPCGLVVFCEQTCQDRHAGSDVMAKVFNRNMLATALPVTQAPGIADDTGALARRLEDVVLWAGTHPETAGLSPGIFAAGHGVPVALAAAARLEERIGALVLRGGLPDRAAAVLPRVTAPVLLIAAGQDRGCVRSHQRALEKLNGDCALNVIPHASATFQDPGAMEEAAQLAVLWFLRHLD